MSAAAIGNSLKEARTKKALTLDEVHAKTKIHPRVLQLLEEGKFDKLPSPVFAKSFLRSYADFLCVNPDELISAYEKESEPKKDPEQILFIRSVEEKQEDSLPYKNIMMPAAIIAAAVAAVLVFSFVVPKILGAAGKGLDAKAWLSPKPDTTVDTQKSAKAAAAAAAARKAEDARKKEAQKKSAEWVRSPEQGNFPKIAKKSPLELRLRALDNVWVRVTADGKVLYQGILGRNAVETWSAKDTLELWTGNAANMFLSVNRFSIGSPGHGMIRKMVITREGVRIPSAENR